MTFLFVLLGIGIVAAVAVLLTGRFVPNWGVGNSGDHRPDIGSEPLFDVAIRGYRMDEVDAKIAELTTEIAELTEKKGGSHGGK